MHQLTILICVCVCSSLSLSFSHLFSLSVRGCVCLCVCFCALVCKLMSAIIFPQFRSLLRISCSSSILFFFYLTFYVAYFDWFCMYFVVFVWCYRDVCSIYRVCNLSDEIIVTLNLKFWILNGRTLRQDDPSHIRRKSVQMFTFENEIWNPVILLTSCFKCVSCVAQLW